MGSTTRNGSTLLAALAYLKAGLAVVPIRLDGSKAPAIAWEPYQRRLATEAEARKWFGRDRPYGIGIVGGGVSGGLECLDFDRDAEVFFPSWCELVEAERPGLVGRLSIVQTPRDPPGFHVRYRCPDAEIPGNVKLATEGRETLIETRGEGGQALAPGCPPECHPSGRLYKHVRGPKLSRVQLVSTEERETLLRAAQSFDRSAPAEEHKPQPRSDTGLSPGDDYNASGPDWPDILVPHGWALAHDRNGIRYWRRPGKAAPGWSATTGVCISKCGHPLFAVFSANAYPFSGASGGRSCSTYSKFAAYALLNHRGDFSAAARRLAEEGYGDRRPRPSTNGDLRAASLESFHLTDLGNARRLVKHFGQDIRHCHPWGKDLAWDGRRWREDDTGQIERWAKETVHRIYREAADEVDEDRRKALAAHAAKSEDARRIRAMMTLARSEPGVPLLPGKLDREVMLLNVLNGTIDLQTGKIRPHRREDLITRLAPVEYDLQAKCPRWERFVLEIMDGNRDLAAYCQRAVGYALTGDVREQCLFFLHGRGANGKTTFLTTLLDIAGDYGCQAIPELFMVRPGENHPTERADLFGRCLVSCIEVEEGKRIAESILKQLTGADRVRARRLWEDFWEFVPTHKLFFAANHKPVVRGTDHAIWRRIKLVPFLVTFEDQHKDPTLPRKLQAELPGILGWAVCGCLAWQQHGLGEPDEVRQATAGYKSEQDTLAGFLEECCLTGDNYQNRAADLYATYRLWAEAAGEFVMPHRRFGMVLTDRGFERGTSNGVIYKRLAVNPEWQEKLRRKERKE